MSRVALIVLDGFGITRIEEGNAVLLAKTPNLDKIYKSFPKALLNASSQEVGLGWGEVGNSEVGHTNIGLGRIVLQDLPQIDKAIASNSVVSRPTTVEINNILTEKQSCLNLMCIFSDGGVHGHINHLISFIEIFKHAPGLKKIYLHLFADGRDCPEKSIEKYIKQIDSQLSEKVEIASLSGRYFAMDRDKNWDRVSLAYAAIFGQSPRKFSSISEAVEDSYTKKETDEFITPCSLSDYKPDLENDVFVFLNFRADRALQLTRCFVDGKFEDFERYGEAKHFYTLTTYDDNLAAKVFFSNIDLNDPETNPLSNSMAKLIADNNQTQFHVGETEKFAHVTYFFSGGIKDPFSGQENKLVPSAKVKSHDMYPQMRAKEITSEIIFAVQKGFDFVVANYANGDMVGHSGNLEASVTAVETLDFYVTTAISELLKNEYSVFLTADHGNCDEMIDLKSKKSNKEHSLNPVPFIYISKSSVGSYTSKNEFFSSQPIGILADIAPTILAELGIETVGEMTGISLKESLS